MEKISIKILLVWLLILTGCAGKHINNDYMFVETQECHLPIPVRFKAITKNDYGYSGLKGEIAMSSITFNKDIEQKDYEAYALDKIEGASYLKLISSKKVKNFIVMQFSMGSDEDNYFIVGKNSLIQLLDISQNEAAYMIDYCINNRK